MKFWIIKTLDGDWALRASIPNRIAVDYESLCYDEMLGTAARLLINGNVPMRGRAMGAIDGQWSLAITQVEGSWYTAERSGLFIDRLTSDEMLGFIAAYCLTDGERQLFSGLQSYEQWSRKFRLRSFVPAGLLTAA